MKKMAALIGALLLTVVSAAPAVAAKPFVTYTVAEAGCSQGPLERDWVSGHIWHGRDRVSGFETFVLIDDQWVPNGTETWLGRVINFDFDEHAFSAVGPTQVRESVFGDFDGIWGCNNGSRCGATMRGLDDAQYDHLEIAVVGQNMVDVVGLPDVPDEACGIPFPEDWYAINTWTLH